MPINKWVDTSILFIIYLCADDGVCVLIKISSFLRIFLLFLVYTFVTACLFKNNWEYNDDWPGEWCKKSNERITRRVHFAILDSYKTSLPHQNMPESYIRCPISGTYFGFTCLESLVMEGIMSRCVWQTWWIKILYRFVRFKHGTYF